MTKSRVILMKRKPLIFSNLIFRCLTMSTMLNMRKPLVYTVLLDKELARYSAYLRTGRARTEFAIFEKYFNQMKARLSHYVDIADTAFFTDRVLDTYLDLQNSETIDEVFKSKKLSIKKVDRKRFEELMEKNRKAIAGFKVFLLKSSVSGQFDMKLDFSGPMEAAFRDLAMEFSEGWRSRIEKFKRDIVMGGADCVISESVKNEIETVIKRLVDYAEAAVKWVLMEYTKLKIKTAKNGMIPPLRSNEDFVMLERLFAQEYSHLAKASENSAVEAESGQNMDYLKKI